MSLIVLFVVLFTLLLLVKNWKLALFAILLIVAPHFALVALALYLLFWRS